MKCSLCSGSFQNDIENKLIDLFGVWQIAVKYGFDALEIRDDLLSDKARDLEALAGLSKKSGIKLIYAAKVSLIHEDDIIMENAVKKIKQAVSEAASVDAGLLKIGFGPVSNRFQFNEKQLSVLKDTAEYAARHGVALCLENSDAPEGSSPFLMKDFFGELAALGLRITFDCGNFAFAGHDPVQACEQLERYVGYVHLKDYKAGEAETTWFGNGEIDFGGIFKRFRNTGYTGYYCFEFPMSINRLGEIDQSFDFIKSHL